MSLIILNESSLPLQPNAALSPDGGSIAFVATGSDRKNAVWVRPMNATEPDRTELGLDQ